MKKALVLLSEPHINFEVTLEKVQLFKNVEDYYVFGIFSYDPEILQVLMEDGYIFDQIFIHKTKGMAGHRQFLKTFYEIFDKVVVITPNDEIKTDLLEEKDEILCGITG